MAKLAIRGHSTRNKEVIEILKMLGGKDSYNYYREFPDDLYYINKYGDIDWYIKVPDSSIVIFTIEEFLEKFPYKVGDKVNYVKYNDEYPNVYTIQNMQWTGTTIEYLLDSSGFSALTKDLQPYKEGITKEKTVNQVCPIFEHKTIGQGTYSVNIAGYKFDSIDKDGNIIVKSIKPKYPKTYEDCCKVLHYCPEQEIIMRGVTEEEEELFRCLILLKRCRYAYWMIAGEEMGLGLGKPWKPDWTDTTIKYCIELDFDIIRKNISNHKGYILAFPTEEMRNSFFENFKELIEICKEFI